MDMEKVNLEQAQRIANELKKKRGYWNSFGWALTGWILHEGRCVYCDADLSDPRKLPARLSGHGDHLLPKNEYPELVREELNMVPSCATCNLQKREYDPSEGVHLTKDDLMYEAKRQELIAKARNFILKNNPVKKESFTDGDFADWQEAMRKWKE
jgi:5-methylcytosine-specific restriction endonuclease McrA